MSNLFFTNINLFLITNTWISASLFVTPVHCILTFTSFTFLNISAMYATGMFNWDKMFHKVFLSGLQELKHFFLNSKHSAAVSCWYASARWLQIPVTPRFAENIVLNFYAELSHRWSSRVVYKPNLKWILSGPINCRHFVGCSTCYCLTCWRYYFKL